MEDKIFKKHGDGAEEQYIHGGNQQPVKVPFMLEKQINKWSVDLFMNDDDEFTEEVTSVAMPDGGVLEHVSHFLCSQSHFLLLKNATKRKNVLCNF